MLKIYLLWQIRIMKKILFLLALAIQLISCGSSKSISYIHKALSEEGCRVSYSATQQNGQLYIIVAVESDRLVFNETPILMLKNFEGKVLKLEGANVQSRTETGGVIISNVVLPISEINAIAQFPIDLADVGFFKPGIAKVRLSTIPIVHEKTFTSDVIGRSLYSELLSAYASETAF